MPRRREPQPEEDMEIKREPKVEVKLEEKKEPSPKGTLSLALQRTHDKLQSPTELLKLHLKHYHMSTEQFKRRTSALKLQKEIYDKFDQITNHATLVPKPRLHPRELRFQEFEVRFLDELTFIRLSLIMEKFLSILNQNFSSEFYMMVQLL